MKTRPSQVQIWKVTGVFVACFYLASCSGVTVDHTPQAVAAHWNAQAGPASPPWAAFPPDASGKREFVFEGIAVKDYEYKRYTELIRRGVSWSGFGAQTAAIGINAAGTLTSGGTTKTLSAIAGTITGASAAFNKNILFDQSITTFIGKMDALRLTKLAEIKTKLAKENIDTYSLAEAYRDVQDYGRLGTLDAAFADVGKKSGEEQAEATDTIKKVRKLDSGLGSNAAPRKNTRITTAPPPNLPTDMPPP